MFENPKNTSLKTDFDNLQRVVRNPFIDVKIWLKYEVLEIDAIMEVIEMRATLIKRRNTKNIKRIENMKELSNLENDKFTLGSVFKSRDQIQRRISELKKEIAQEEKDLHSYDSLTKLATMVLVKNAIPFFKTCKFQTYY